MNDNPITENIRVFLRQRLFTPEESDSEPGSDAIDLKQGGECCLVQQQNQKGKQSQQNDFKFSGCFLPDSSQEDVYEKAAKPIIDSALQGYSGTIFAYGPTGSGKTFTMRGGEMHEKKDAGIMMRCVEQLLSSTQECNGLLTVSYLQIYCEMITDLLDNDATPDGDNQLSIREKDGGVYVEGLKHSPLRSLSDFENVLSRGDANRVTAETNMNATSSRSHTALMITVRIPEGQQTSTDDDKYKNKSSKNTSYKESTLFLVDLAGSERSTASAGQQYKRLEEGKAINLSLSSLGNCMNALAENRKHVPYRDSKLTRLLQGSLGGGARTSVIVTLPPCVPQYSGMVLPVLRFASRAMKVRVSAKIARFVDYEALYNEVIQKLDKREHDKNASLVDDGQKEELLERREWEAEQLREENAMLKAQLAALMGPQKQQTAQNSPKRDDSDNNNVFLTDTNKGDNAKTGPQSADPVDVERYWREQMQDLTDKHMTDAKATRQKFETKVRTLNKNLDAASAEVLSLQNDLTQEREAHYATVQQTKQYQQRLQGAEQGSQSRIDELLGDLTEMSEMLDNERSQSGALAEENNEAKRMLLRQEVNSDDMIPRAQLEELETLFSETVTKLTSRMIALEDTKHAPSASGGGSAPGSRGANDSNRNGSNGPSYSIPAGPNSKRLQPGGRVRPGQGSSNQNQSNNQSNQGAPGGKKSLW